jgi:hypothetical protein
MIVAPAVTVHGMDDALAALCLGAPVTLLSAPGAASVGGCLWWRALVEGATAAWPDTPCDDILDCGDAPGWAMAALRIGQRALVLNPACPAFPALAGAAGTIGARVLAARPVSLDLAHPRARARLEGWLRP